MTGRPPPLPDLPEGVVIRALAIHRDERGWLTEIFRREWPTGIAPVQWNAVRSAAGMLRGVHVHVHHTDHIALLQGRAGFGLHDLRPASPTFGRTALIEI
jgi:dTDP-4-dehydrorhamnose 3,5-epimerase